MEKVFECAKKFLWTLLGGKYKEYASSDQF